MNMINTILIIISWIVSLFVLWGASKYFKLKRNTFKFAFITVIIFAFITLFLTLIYLLLSPPFITKLIIGLVVSTLGWIYVISRIYKVSMKMALKVFVFMVIVGGIIYGIIFFAFFSVVGILGLEIIPEKSCEEKYSSFTSILIKDKEGVLIRCYSKQALEKKDSDICNQAKDTSVKDGCYLILAEENKDVNICNNKISDPTKRENCYLEVAIATLDQKLCLKIVSNLQWNYNCYEIIAKNLLEPSICHNLPGSGPYNKYACELHVNIGKALLKNNPSYCDALTVQWKKNSCYFEFATREKDENFCYKMTDVEPGDNEIENCINVVKKMKNIQK